MCPPVSTDRSERVEPLVIADARVVTPGRVLKDAYVRIDGDRITEVGRGPVPDVDGRIDADGRLLMPGLIDLHGDDLERYRFPREEASVDVDTALLSSDRANVAAGITTKYHAVAFENAPHDNRSVRLARDVTETLGTVDGLLGNNRVNARCELGDDRAVEAVLRAMDRDVVGLVSLMNHLPNCGQFDGVAQFERRYTDGGHGPRDPADRIHQQRRRVAPGPADESTRRVVEGARNAGLPVASHDDETADHVDAMAALDVSISEYPVSMAAMRRAAERDMTTVMGAPNLVRGNSLWGNLSAADAIGSGLVDVLCTDYHPASLIETVFIDTGEPLPARVERVTTAPAEAVGLRDRGRIEGGARADLILVEPASPPRIQRAFVAGDEVYRATAAR